MFALNGTEPTSEDRPEKFARTPKATGGAVPCLFPCLRGAKIGAAPTSRIPDLRFYAHRKAIVVAK